MYKILPFLNNIIHILSFFKFINFLNLRIYSGWIHNKKTRHMPEKSLKVLYNNIK